MRVNPTEKYCTWHLILEVSSWRGPQQDIIRTRNVRTPLLVCSTEKCPGPWKSLPEGRMQRPLSQKVFHRIFMLCSCYFAGFHAISMVFGWYLDGPSPSQACCVSSKKLKHGRWPGPWPGGWQIPSSHRWFQWDFKNPPGPRLFNWEGVQYHLTIRLWLLQEYSTN